MELHKHGRKQAFTLAEVLITLGVIGVVAAITIPGLISKYQKHVLHNQFKQACSILSQMHQRMLNDDIAIYQEFVTDDIILDSVASKHIETIVKYLNASVCNSNYLSCTGGSDYKTLNGEARAHIGADSYTAKTILLNNGMTLWRGNLRFGRNKYYIDTNGTAKGPNKLGYDLFTFVIDSSNKLVPEKNNPNLSKSCSFINPANTNVYLGFGCAHYALADENPDEPGKTYWKDFLK